jgi:hypothetical protein
MNSRVRIIFCSMMIVFIALLSAFTVIPARADDGAPPAPAAPAGPSAKTASTSSVLSDVPAGTDVVVVNRSGHKVALASQEAARIVANGDPMWCPAGVVPGAAACSPSGNSSFQSVIDWLALQHTGKAGVIWVQSTYDRSSGDSSSTSFVLNGDVTTGNLPLFAPFSLTIKGGWNGNNGSIALDPAQPWSVIDGASLNIVNWKGAVTLNNITIKNAPIDLTTDPAGDGLTVSTKSNIVLNNVNAADNSGAGANLDNCFSNTTICTGTGVVTVNYSTFSGNTGDGLDVFSNRGIYAKNLTVLNNQGDGTRLDNSNALSAQPVTLTSVNNFSYNTGSGLVVHSTGTITLGNVTALHNSGSWGAYLDNCGDINSSTNNCNTPGAYNITLAGSNNFSNNAFDGLDVWASGMIKINNLTAVDNGTGLTTPTVWTGMGAYLNNFGAPIIRPLTLTGTNTFTGNAAAGLYMDSWGAVSVSNLTANENGLNVNCLPAGTCAGVYVERSGAFTLTGYGVLNGNGNGAGDAGLVAYSWGAMSLTNLVANGNAGWGVYLDNSTVTHPANLTLIGTNVFTNNQYTGLVAYSDGVINMSNVTASYNGLAGDAADGYGAFVDNCFVDPTPPHHCGVKSAKSVILTGTSFFNNNKSDGLWVNSLGAVSASRVTANNNGGNGAYLDNQWMYQTFKITLTGNNVFNGNQAIGLEVFSNGAITISNLTANENKGGTPFKGVITTNAGGAYLDNIRINLIPVPVTLTGFNTFNGNGSGVAGSGLTVYTDGAITISNLTASYNHQTGAFLDNLTRTLANHNRTITLSGANTFSDNGARGLEFYGSGIVNLYQLTVDTNGTDGLYGGQAGPTNIICGNFFNNSGRGIDITFAGFTVTLKGVTSGMVTSNNGSDDFINFPKVVKVACPIP